MSNIVSKNGYNNHQNDTLANLPSQVQQVLPVLTDLNLEQKVSLFRMVFADNSGEPSDINAQATPANNVSNNATDSTNTKKLTPLDRQYFKEVWISDDFDEHLGDDFWLGHEHELV